ncbi:MAG: M48 family metallopeptidase [Bacteroidales bacterium]|nr:M48 family metallopeptidase [Bacteroidales bacterium]
MIKKIIIISVLFAFISCAKVPITGRKQVKMLPESTLIQMGLTSYRDFISKNPPAPSNDKNTIMVKNAGTKITQAVTQFLKGSKQSKRIEGFKWEYNLVNDPTVNAWCMPGGKVVVYSGILALTQDETGLAVVMGHEIAHAVCRHGNERMSQQILIQLGGIGLALAMSQKPQETQNIFLMCYGVGGTLGSLAYSRVHEYEADKLGLIFMAMAGYNPEVAVSFWQRMAAMGGAKPPQFLSTHPSDENRIKELRAFLPTAKKYYKG